MFVLLMHMEIRYVLKMKRMPTCPAAIAVATSGYRRCSDGKSVAKLRQRAVDRVGRVLFLRTEEVEQAVQ